MYVAITEGVEGGVMAVDLRKASNPYAYPYVGPAAGNTTPEFRSADNLALDRKGNLAITEDPGGDLAGGKTPGRRHLDRRPAEGQQRP